MKHKIIAKKSVTCWTAWGLGLLLLFLGLTAAVDVGSGAGGEKGKPGAETVRIMPFVNGRALCEECHAPDELAAANPVLPCAEACFQCHKDMEAHHQTGMNVTFSVPDHFRLAPGNKVTCITCHDLTIPRFSREARKAQSLFERVFGGKKQYKTYYLFMDNRKGQLCKTCH